jgi:hypothetical protein
MADKYILDGHSAIPEEDLMTWANWFEKADRVVKKSKLSSDVTISTVFLGLNHNFEEGEPLLFETLIFGGTRDGEMNRYSTWDEAVKDHERILKEFTDVKGE